MYVASYLCKLIYSIHRRVLNAMFRIDGIAI